MQTVKVKKTELQTVVTANRTTHRAAFEEALEGYRVEAIEFLDQTLADAKAGKRFHRALTMPEPQDHTVDYDRVLRMLEMSVEDVVELQEHEFEQFVMDKWAWREAFAATNARYHGKKSVVHIGGQ